jgi:hypothetical protein
MKKLKDLTERKGRKFIGKMLIPAKGVKKSDIWLLVVFPAEIQGKRSSRSWVWEGREERE